MTRLQPKSPSHAPHDVPVRAWTANPPFPTPPKPMTSTDLPRRPAPTDATEGER